MAVSKSNSFPSVLLTDQPRKVQPLRAGSLGGATVLPRATEAV